MANFADESVGAVSGELVLFDECAKEASDSVGAHWRYEKRLRAMRIVLKGKRSIFDPAARASV